MTWENCHEYFLSKEFKEDNPDLSNLIENLSFYIRTSNRGEQKKTALKLISIVNGKEVPKMINQFKGSIQEAEIYLNKLKWNPVKIYCSIDGINLNIIAIR